MTGGRDAHWDVGIGYSRARGNFNLPGVYRDRIFRAFRGFGGPDCGVGVSADRSSPAGMALGPLGSAVAGQGPCMYYNPFSNAIQYADQPGARFRSTRNPDHVPALANPDQFGPYFFTGVHRPYQAVAEVPTFKWDGREA